MVQPRLICLNVPITLGFVGAPGATVSIDGDTPITDIDADLNPAAFTALTLTV